MFKQDSLKESDKKSLLILFAIISFLGYFIDIFVIDPPQITLIANIAAIFIVFVTLILDHFLIINKKKSFWILIYLLIINLLISHYTNIEKTLNSDLLISILIICALIPLSAFAIGKKHALYICFILMIYIISWNIIKDSAYLDKNIYTIILTIMGYSLGIYYIISLLELRTKNEQALLSEVKKHNSDTIFLKTLAFEMVDFASENETIPQILKNVKKHTGAKFATFSIYDSSQKALILSGIEADGALLKTSVKIAGEKVLNTASPVNDEMYDKIVGEVIGLQNSLTEVTFGAIPESLSKPFSNLTGISLFYGIAHIISGQLYGTTMLAFKNNQTLPSKDLLKSYAHLAALLLRRNLVERQLLVSENNLRSITDNITDVVIRTNLNFETIYVSPSIKNLTGDTPEVFREKKLEEKYTLESVKKIRSTFLEEIENEKDPNIDKNRTRIIELELLKKNTKKINVAIHLSFMRNKEGQATSFQGVIRDITETKKYEAQLIAYSKELKQLNLDKDLFMKILAHDLRSPFNSIIGFSSLLLANLNKYSNEEITKHLTLIKNSSLKTFNLLNDLLLWSNSQSNKLKMNKEKLIFFKACNESIEEKKELAEEKQITIKCNSDKSIYIQSDINLFKTILRNLLSNAIKFTHKNGRIDIFAENNDIETIVTVADNGIGMSSQEITKLWNISKPHTSVGTAKEKGTGFGLVLCKEFIEKQGGKIWVESEKGKGSNFKFTLPFDK